MPQFQGLPRLMLVLTRLWLVGDTVIGCVLVLLVIVILLYGIYYNT